MASLLSESYELVASLGIKRADPGSEVRVNRYRGRQASTSGRRLWLGLLLVVLFLSHDVLMALESVVTPHASAAAMHHGAPPHAPQTAYIASHAATPAPDHPEQCGVGTTALPRGLAAFLHVAQMLPDGWSLDIAASPTQQRAALVWEEPHWPPGTLRALWQVYRI
jgi:hypothetical protein